MQTATYDFPVALRPVYDERHNEIPKFKSVTRTDNHRSLSIVSDRYKLIPHRQMVDAFEPFSRELGAHTTQFYQERDGARLVMEQTFRGVNFSIPGHNIPGQGRSTGDVVALKTYGINSYNTTTPLTLRVGCLVLRCLNGATAFESIFGLNIRHVGSGDPEINLPSPQAVIDVFNQTATVWQEWAGMSLLQRDRDYLFEEAINYGITNKRMYEKEKARFDLAETVWDAYNALTYVITHSTRRIQETSRLNRFDRLNLLFSSWQKSQV